jgi:hypothetical protein
MKSIVEQPKSRCVQCNSTERSGYTNTETKQISGIRDGQPYNRIVWRRCKCSSCGKHRVDKSFEFVAESPAGTKVRGEAKKENSEVRRKTQTAKTETPKQNLLQEPKPTTKKLRSGKGIG